MSEEVNLNLYLTHWTIFTSGQICGWKKEKLCGQRKLTHEKGKSISEQMDFSKRPCRPLFKVNKKRTAVLCYIEESTKLHFTVPWAVWDVTKFLRRVSVVCVYNDKAYRSEISSGLFSRKVFLSPLPPAWKYCLIVSSATSSTAHWRGVKFLSAAWIGN